MLLSDENIDNSKEIIECITFKFHFIIVSGKVFELASVLEVSLDGLEQTGKPGN